MGNREQKRSFTTSLPFPVSRFPFPASRMHEPRGPADPALDQLFGLPRMLRQHVFADLLHRGQQVRVAGEVGDAEAELAGLTGAEHFARTAQFEILLGDAKTVV